MLLSCIYWFWVLGWWKELWNVWEIILPNISIQGGVVHPNIHGLFDGPSQVVLLPAYNLEVLHWCFMATTILMSKNWRWCLQMCSKAFTKCPLLTTRCPYWGAHLTKGQPDPMADQMSSWPEVVLLLATRCLYQGWGCMSDQRSAWSKADQMSSWPEVVLLLATRCLYQGMGVYVWSKVSLTQRLTKCQTDLK